MRDRKACLRVTQSPPERQTLHTEGHLPSGWCRKSSTTCRLLHVQADKNLLDAPETWASSDIFWCLVHLQFLDHCDESRLRVSLESRISSCCSFKKVRQNIPGDVRDESGFGDGSQIFLFNRRRRRQEAAASTGLLFLSKARISCFWS